MASRPPSPLPLRQFPSSGFIKLDPKEKIEEENLPFYASDIYYPVYIGEVFASRYQVVSKLGYGMSSTAWLCRDLYGHGFNTLKVGIRGQRQDHELAVSDHLKQISNHSSKSLVRLILDSFEISGPHGQHTCIIYEALGMSFADFQELFPNRKLPEDLLQRSLQLILISVAFIHENDIVHTDISPNNILQGIKDLSILDQIEEGELKMPIARKVLDDSRQLYFSRPVPIATGLPVLSDFGEARIGKTKQRGDVMPGIYRAPEVILEMEWNEKIDIWSIGVMAWDMAFGRHLFFAKKEGILNDEQHLAEMTSLIGPPPPEFLQRSAKSHLYWDSDGISNRFYIFARESNKHIGNWKGSLPLPEQSWELRAQHYCGVDKELFLGFLRRVLCWLPEARPSAEELAYDEFLMQPLLRE
ncbi:hypothetical protein N7462_008261 [Penicillium macrosclerotiorum]|uniref:uncharacterized protein n=1 Tax=Penicillium macrosclerotiorum TaxID=303699 RepID=UPI00254695FF|nr:uncharacterized protein N7462_008261 [Penicillium macrosclerotiorum]KAJ5675364.1 hypothetical protein N7462_008261 [Penicillium macrosclerotiorum]